MQRHRHSILAALTALVVAAPTAAHAAGQAALTLKVPQTVKVGQSFTVEASGKATFPHNNVRVFFDTQSCLPKGSLESGRTEGPGATAREVIGAFDIGPGHFDKKNSKAKALAKGKKNVCGYLEDKNGPDPHRWITYKTAHKTFTATRPPAVR